MKQNCTTAKCATVGEESLCSQTCFLGTADACPAGFQCLDTGTVGQGLCWPGGGEEPGGCCSVGDESELALLAQLGLTFAVGFVLIRRRRRRA